MTLQELNNLTSILSKFMKTGRFPDSEFDNLTKEDRENPKYTVIFKFLGKIETKPLENTRLIFKEDTDLLRIEFKEQINSKSFSYMEIPLCELQMVTVKYILATRTTVKVYKSNCVQYYKPEGNIEEDEIEENGEDTVMVERDTEDNTEESWSEDALWPNLDEILEEDYIPEDTDESVECPQTEQIIREVYKPQEINESPNEAINLGLLEKAIEYSMSKHSEQKDKAGKSYIFHPLTVALHPTLTTIQEKIVGLLHDIIEDTDTKKEELYDLFPGYIVDTVLLLTHDSSEPYMSYIKRLVGSNNILALKAKRADLDHNMRIERIPSPTEKDYDRIEKYQISYEIVDLKIQELERSLCQEQKPNYSSIEKMILSK